jgi:hypothetical protein
MVRYLLASMALSGSLLLQQARPPRLQQPPLPEVLYPAASAVAPALADVQTLPVPLRPYIRYASGYHLTDTEAKEWMQTLTFAVNGWSRERVLVAPAPVPGGHGRLWRVNLKAYGIDPAAWDKLLSAGSGRSPVPEPYFRYVQVAETDTYRTDHYGHWDYSTGQKKWVRTHTEKVYLGKKKVHEVLQPSWLPKTELLLLIAETHSEYPIGRVDWLTYYGYLEPRYHELLGLGERKADFLKLALVKEGEADREGEELRGVVLDSEVANNNRGLERRPTLRRYGTGWEWESLDYGTSIQGNNLLQDLLNKKPQAQELIASLPNGLQFYLVTDGAGKRLDRAGIEFAQDRRNNFRSVEVEIRNCLCCHTQGLIPIDDAVRNRVKDKVAASLAKLQEENPQKAQRILEHYFAADVNALLKTDQANYAAAVKSCNGLDAAANGLQFLKLLLAYEAKVNLATLVRDSGYPQDVVLGVIERSKGSGLDESIVSLATGATSRRDQYEALGFGQIMTLLAAVPQQGIPP